MESKDIKKQALNMKSQNDLLILLNKIKKDEMTKKGESYYPFTHKQINFLKNPNHNNRFITFSIKKKQGGKRIIYTPKYKSTLILLKSLNILLKSIYSPSDHAMGFTEGRSVVNNALLHKGKNYVFNIDLKDFFPSISQARVWKRLQLEPFNFSEGLANVIAGMCCVCEKNIYTKENKYFLPQGAPTSPIITNMICDKLDRRLNGLAKRFHLTYSRYADDITFSSYHNVYNKDGEFIKELNRIITDQGFTINTNKTRLQKKGSRQEVTGVIVNEKLNVNQSYVRDIRNLLYIWNRYGYNAAYIKFCLKYAEDRSNLFYKDTKRLDMINVLHGRLMYLKMIKGKSDSVFKDLNSKFNKLFEKQIKANTTKKGISYIETSTIKAFENHNFTEIIFASTNLKQNPFSDIHNYAYFIIDDYKFIATLPNRFNLNTDKSKLSITSCRTNHQNSFWLIHNSNYNFMYDAIKKK